MHREKCAAPKKWKETIMTSARVVRVYPYSNHNRSWSIGKQHLGRAKCRRRRVSRTPNLQYLSRPYRIHILQVNTARRISHFHLRARVIKCVQYLVCEHCLIVSALSTTSNMHIGRQSALHLLISQTNSMWRRAHERYIAYRWRYTQWKWFLIYRMERGDHIYKYTVG